MNYLRWQVRRRPEFEPHPDDDKMIFGPVGGGFLERMDPFLLADPYVVSGWVTAPCSPEQGAVERRNNWGGVKC